MLGITRIEPSPQVRWRAPWREERIAMLLFGRDRDALTIRYAASIAAEREAEVVAFQVAPVAPPRTEGPILEAGLDPRQLEREDCLASRTKIRALIEEACLSEAVPILMSGRPTYRSAIRNATAQNCSALVLPKTLVAPLVRAAARRRGLLEVMIADRGPALHSQSARSSPGLSLPGQGSG